MILMKKGCLGKTRRLAGVSKSVGFAVSVWLFFSASTALGQATVPANIARALAEKKPTTVIVLFDDKEVLEEAQAAVKVQKLEFSDKSIQARLRTGYAALKTAALKDLSTVISKEIDYANLPMAALTVSDPDALSQLLAQPRVAAVYENVPHQKVLAESLPQIKADTVHALGKKGAGATVAVLDTGVNYNLAAFGNCSAPNVPASCSVVFARDFAPEDGYGDDDGHGTNVSAIIAGVAPDAKIAGLDVFDGEYAYSTAIINAIDWVIANKQQYNIVAMNLSLGVGGSSYSSECSSWASVPFARARAAGVIPVVATGNDGFSGGINSPACAPGAVRVGAVFDYTGSSYYCSGGAAVDKVTCFSNSAPGMVTLLAPGSKITAADFTMSGTSQATPHVAGAIAVLRAPDAFPDDTLDGTVSRLASSGDPITDTRNNTIVSRLNLDAAIAWDNNNSNNNNLVIQILNDDDNLKRR